MNNIAERNSAIVELGAAIQMIKECPLDKRNIAGVLWRLELVMGLLKTVEKPKKDLFREWLVDKIGLANNQGDTARYLAYEKALSEYDETHDFEAADVRAELDKIKNTAKAVRQDLINCALVGLNVLENTEKVAIIDFILKGGEVKNDVKN